MTHQQQSVEHLFGTALDLPPELRRDFLDRACRDAPELRLLVEELLREDERAGSFLRAPLFDHTSQADPRIHQVHQDRTLSSPDTRPRFQPSHLIANRFVVVRFIARGGMGEVYEVADQLLHGTHVALKVIRPEIAADAGSSHRFEQEVILARKVHHHNLCPIYEIFRCDEPAPAFLFLTMKLLHGETLETRLRSSKLSRVETLAIWTGMVEGLAALHNVGVIHRDIKPNNVMIEHSGPRLCVSIMDFGLARLHESEATIFGSATIAGTPGYLAPELLQGHHPTKATDLFALGVVLHEMLTGERPAETRNGLIVTPRPSLDLADAPPALLQTVKHLLSDDPDQRCRAFDDARAVPPSATPVALLSPPQPRPFTRRRFFVTASATAGTLAGAALWQRGAIYNHLHPLPIKRFVALLDWPSSDASIRPMLLSLIDAMANELARAEAFDHNFFVAAQTHAADLKSPADLDQVRESLGANLVLAASGSSTPKHLSVSLHVLDPASGRTLRSANLRTPLDQQFSLPERVVRTAARLLDVSNYDPDDTRSRAGTDNPEALQAFQAAELYRKQENDTGLEQAIEKYKEALEIDAHYAIAQARLSWAYIRSYGLQADTAALALARDNAESALALNPKLVEAHLALAWIMQKTGDRETGFREVSKALSLDPANPLTILYQARFYADDGRYRQAEETYTNLIKLRPNLWLAHNEFGVLLEDEGRYSEALMQYRSASLAAPKNALAYNNIGSVYLQLGKLDEAVQNCKSSLQLKPNGGAARRLAVASRILGRFTEAIAYAKLAVKLSAASAANWVELGDVYESSGKFADEAIAAYKQAAEVETEELHWSARSFVPLEELV